MEDITDKQKYLMDKLKIDIPDGCTKEFAIKLIGEKVGPKKEETTQTTITKADKKPVDQPSYYVAYAKDLFIAQCEAGAIKTTSATELMDECVDLIMNAKARIEG